MINQEEERNLAFYLTLKIKEGNEKIVYQAEIQRKEKNKMAGQWTRGKGTHLY